MAKYYGKIGYVDFDYESPGIAKEDFTEKFYYGDVLQNVRRLQSENELNDNIVVSNRISIVSNPYAMENFHKIRYAEFMGTKWKVTSVDVQYPRLILTLGGVFNDSTGPSFDTMSDSEVSGDREEVSSIFSTVS